MAEDFGGIDKKHWLYIGGAVASIAALIWLFKRQSSSAMPVMQPTRTTGGGASSDALTAAQMQSATALAIEQGREQIALAQIGSAERIAGVQAATALEVQRATQSGQTARAALGALGTPGGAAAIGAAGTNLNTLLKGLFDLFKGSPSTGEIQGPNIPAGWTYNEATGQWQQGSEIQGPNIPAGWTFNETLGQWEQGGYIGNFGTIYEEPIGPNLPDLSNAISDYGYTTTTGGGSSDWYGGGMF